MLRKLVFFFVALGACGGSSQHTTATTAADEGSAAAEPTRYEVSIDRDPEIGARYRVTSTARNHQSSRLTAPNGQVIQNDVSDKRVTVVGVLERTAESTYRFTVETFDLEGEESPVSPGAVLQVQRGEPPTISIGGEAVDANVAELISLALPTGPNDDEDSRFGPGQPQPVGGTWPFPSESVDELVAKMNVQVDPESIEGHLELVEHVSEPVDAVRVHGNLRIGELHFPMPNSTTEEAHLGVDMTWLLPTDTSQVSPEGSVDMTLEARLLISDPNTGEQATMVMEFHRQSRRTMERI